MRRTLYAVGGLVAGTTLLVAVKTAPGATPVAQDPPARTAAGQAAPLDAAASGKRD